MNWRKIHEAWKRFAANLGGELQMDEKPYLQGVRVNYRIEFTDDFGRTKYLGSINKSVSGYNLYRMNIETEAIGGIQFEEKEVKRRNRLARFFKPLNSSKDVVKQQMKRCLYRTGAVKISMQRTLLKMEFDFVPTDDEEFDFINAERINLIEKISTPSINS